MKRSVLYFILFFGCFLGLKAQEEKEINHQLQSWWSVNSTTRITESLGVIGDFHFRANDFFSESNFYFSRIGLAYWTSDKLTVVGGYAHLWLAVPSLESGTVYQNENRIYQQAQWRHDEGKVILLNRIRNEQRWHEVLNPDGSVDRIRFSNRVRILMSATIPIFRNEFLPALSVAEEMHFHFGKDLIFNTFDQNRIFLGMKQKISPNLKFDIGYMMVYQQKSTGFEYDLNHTFRWFFYYTPDLRKSKKGPHYSIPGDE